MTKVRKIGNSFGVIIPTNFLKLVDFNQSDNLTIHIEDKKIIIEKENNLSEILEIKRKALFDSLKKTDGINDLEEWEEWQNFD